MQKNSIFKFRIWGNFIFIMHDKAIHSYDLDKSNKIFEVDNIFSNTLLVFDGILLIRQNSIWTE